MRACLLAHCIGCNPLAERERNGIRRKQISNPNVHSDRSRTSRARITGLCGIVLPREASAASEIEAGVFDNNILTDKGAAEESPIDPDQWNRCPCRVPDCTHSF